MVNYKSEAKRVAIATAIIVVPVFLLAAYFSNVHAGPGIEFLFWLGVFLLLPVYLLKEIGAFSGSFGAWVAILLTEPLWLFILTFGIRIAWLELKQRYITVPSSGRGKRRRAA